MFYGSVRAPKSKEGIVSILVHFPGSPLNPKFGEKTLNLLDFPNGPLNLEQTVVFEGIEGGNPPPFTVSLTNIDTQVTLKISKKGNKVTLSLPRDGTYQLTYEAKGYDTRSEYFVVEEKKIAERTNIPETITLFLPRHMQVRYQHSQNGEFTEASPTQTMIWSEAEADITNLKISNDWRFRQKVLENGQPSIVIDYHNWGKTNGYHVSSKSFDELLQAPKIRYKLSSREPVHKGDVFLFKGRVERTADVFTKLEIIEISKSPIEE